MIFKLVIIISLIVSIECKQSYIIKGPGWRSEMKKCASGGDDQRNYPFHIGNLESTQFKYADINRHTYVRAYGDLELHTKKSDSLKETSLQLTDYVEQDDYKEFSKNWRIERSTGWATQVVAIGLTVKINKGGLIELNNYVYAGSWGAVSCAWAKAYVDAIEIVN